MTAKLDGTNGLLQQYDYQVLTTAFSYTFAAGTTVLVINPAGTLATGTITMPAAPADGMTITVESTQQVTALTMSGNGGTVVGPAIQLIPNQPLSWVYRLTNTSWYPVFGGAGRASALVSGTAVTLTTQTSVDFTSIPSWVKRITVMFNAVSLSGTAYMQVQLGDSGGVENTGYTGSVTIVGNGGTGVSTALSAGFQTENHTYWTAASTRMGMMTITNVSGNIWTANWVLGAVNPVTQANGWGGGVKTLTDTLDRVRITTTGSDTLDGGSVNILYE